MTLSPKADICVAHLVRRSNPVSAFAAFLDSYRRCAAGAPHELLVLFKGFSNPAQLAPYETLLADQPHARMFVRDFGFDVRPYMQAARAYPHRFFVFFNSFSRILIPGWLEMMVSIARRPGVGIVGATGSHQSIASDNLAMRWFYRKSAPAYRRPLSIAYRYARYLVSIRGRFPAFPNFHVRSNAFLVPREVMTGLRCGLILGKWDAYQFESGAAGMTRQIMDAGLLPVVAGKDGLAYEPRDWPESRTFWIGNQENLLVSDNQTRAYAEGDPGLRERLAFCAWRRYPDGAPRQDLPPMPD